MSPVTNEKIAAVWYSSMWIFINTCVSATLAEILDLIYDTSAWLAFLDTLIFYSTRIYRLKQLKHLPEVRVHLEIEMLLSKLVCISNLNNQTLFRVCLQGYSVLYLSKITVCSVHVLFLKFLR